MHSNEADRSARGSNSCSDPASSSSSGTSTSISDRDVASLRKKFRFLEDFSDNFIRTTPYEALLKTETTAMKLSEFERNKAVSSRLSSNRDKLSSCFSSVSSASSPLAAS